MSSSAHANPSRNREEPLYDRDVAAPSHAERARTLVEKLHTASLATLAKDPEGHPYASFLTFALEGGDPIFLISEMAEHTQNLRRDGRASLLAAESRSQDPLANGRVTLLGTCRLIEEGDQSARQAYLQRLPNASYYCDFKDFNFWRLSVDSLRYIGGYGRMSWVSGEEWKAAQPDPLAAHAEGIVDHMNADHAEAMALLCRVFSKAREAQQVSMTAIDRYGFEMSVMTERGPRPVRLAFPQPADTPDAARQALIALVSQARKA
ncbi:MAG TPA: DUF2470 domain-containing protein [Acidobacteriota bacterium]|nr:DUF2470 domain-containing protein [Acidobacteriota bacterium]